MRHHKKAEGSALSFLLLKGIGAAYPARDVDLGDIAGFIDAELAGASQKECDYSDSHSPEQDQQRRKVDPRQCNPANGRS